MPRFASGKYALAICAVCGCECKYTRLMQRTIAGKPAGLKTCPDCFDPDHPLNFLPRVIEQTGSDAQALRTPQPDDNSTRTTLTRDQLTTVIDKTAGPTLQTPRE